MELIMYHEKKVFTVILAVHFYHGINIMRKKLGLGLGLGLGRKKCSIWK